MASQLDPLLSKPEKTTNAMPKLPNLVQVAIFLCLVCLAGVLFTAMGMSGQNERRNQCCASRTFLKGSAAQQRQNAAGDGSSRPQQLVGQQREVAEQTVPLACEELLPAGSLQSVYHFQQPGGHAIAFMDETNMTIIRTNLRGEQKRTAVQDVLAHFLVRGCSEQQAGAAAAAPALFVDVGSNVGWFSVMAAVHGCQVLLFDPQPICVATIRKHLCLNRQHPMISNAHGVAIVNHPVSNVSGVSINMTVPDYCAQAFNVDAGLEVPKRHKQKRKIERSSHATTTVSIDDLLLGSGLEVFLMKIDVEGYEGIVLSSISRLIAAQRIRRLVIELTPGFWKRDNVTRLQMVDALLPLLSHGCVIQRILDLDWSKVHAAPPAGRAAADADDEDLDAVVDWTVVIDSKDKLQQYITVDLIRQEDIFVLCRKSQPKPGQQ